MLPPNSPWPANMNGTQLVEVKALYFVGKVIPTTGYHYIGCRFDNCNIQHGILNMKNCLSRNSEKD